jgi:hypothetical protein
MTENGPFMGTNSYIGDRPLGEIIQDVMRDVGEVIRGEVRLAKAEMGEKVSKAGKAGGLLAGAALFGVMGFAALVFAAISGLSMVVPTWAAAMIVGIFLLGAGGALFAVGRAALKTVTPVPERTVQTLKDDVEWAKHPTR